MGVNVSLVRIGEKYTDKLPYISHPGYRHTDASDEFGWDWIRHSGDSEIDKLMDGDRKFIDETQCVGRPKDVEAMRAQLLALGVNEGRWNLLADTLRDNADIYVMSVW